MSQLFKNVKSRVNARQAAEMYGMRINPGGMTCCPFHHDRSPSMKLDERFYCFGCGATGDAIDLTAQLLGLSAKDAALRLAADFGIDVNEDKANARRYPQARGNRSLEEIEVNHHPSKSDANSTKAVYSYRTAVDSNMETPKWSDSVTKVLIRYRSLLWNWKKNYAPRRIDEEWHPLFCEALQRKEYINYLLDELVLCSGDQLEDFKNSYGMEVTRIGKRLERYV